jgi:hypothetical protein
MSKSTSMVEIWQDIGFRDNTNNSLCFVGNLVFKILRPEYMLWPLLNLNATHAYWDFCQWNKHVHYYMCLPLPSLFIYRAERPILLRFLNVLNKFNDFIIKTIGFLFLVKYIGSGNLM